MASRPGSRARHSRTQYSSSGVPTEELYTTQRRDSSQPAGDNRQHRNDRTPLNLYPHADGTDPTEKTRGSRCAGWIDGGQHFPLPAKFKFHKLAHTLGQASFREATKLLVLHTWTRSPRLRDVSQTCPRRAARKDMPHAARSWRAMFSLTATSPAEEQMHCRGSNTGRQHWYTDDGRMMVA